MRDRRLVVPHLPKEMRKGINRLADEVVHNLNSVFRFVGLLFDINVHICLETLIESLDDAAIPIQSNGFKLRSR